ncbi:SpoIID/LytB domain-containing protein [bacterium]|nr:SpoIID/LytB domain-containing protein [bacterium]
MKTARLITLVLAALVLAGCGVTSEAIIPVIGATINKQETVRVAIKSKVNSVVVNISGAGSYYDQTSGTYMGRFAKVANARITVENGFLAINGKTGQGKYRSSRIMMVPEEGALINVDGVNYRGQMEFISNGSTLTVVNHLGLEEYLCGVVPKETFASWPTEALKAQAICSRSYTIAKCEENYQKDYDLTSPGDQLYGGASAEAASTTAAVYGTAGNYLEYNGKPLLTFFHTCCGGATEDGEKIFTYVRFYPSGVTSPYCKGCKHYEWEYSIGAADLASKLKAAGYNPGNAAPLQVTKRFNSGRVAEIRIGSATLTGEQLRKAVGYDVIKSTRFSVLLNGSVYTFKGNGWGHGVGMCQWCTKGMADQGITHEKMLEHFYPGAKLR